MNSFTIPRKPKFAAKIPPVTPTAEYDNKPVSRKKRNRPAQSLHQRDDVSSGEASTSYSVKRSKKSDSSDDNRKAAPLYQKIKLGRTLGYLVTVTQGGTNSRVSQHDAILLNCDENPEEYLAKFAYDDKVKIRWRIAGWSEYVAVQTIRLKQIDAAPPTRKAAANSGLMLQSSDGGMITTTCDDTQKEDDEENYHDEECPDEPLVCYTKKSPKSSVERSNGSNRISLKYQSRDIKTEDIETDDEVANPKTVRRRDVGVKTEDIDTDDETVVPCYKQDAFSLTPDQVESEAAAKLTDSDMDISLEETVFASKNGNVKEKGDGDVMDQKYPHVICCTRSKNRNGVNEIVPFQCQSTDIKTEDIDTDDDVAQPSVGRSASDEINEVGVKTEEIDTDDEVVTRRNKDDTYNITNFVGNTNDSNKFSAQYQAIDIKTEDIETYDDVANPSSGRRASDDSSLEEGEIKEVVTKALNSARNGGHQETIRDVGSPFLACRTTKYPECPRFSTADEPDELIQIAHSNLQQLSQTALAAFWNLLSKKIWTEQVSLKTQLVTSYERESRLIRLFQHTMNVLDSLSAKNLTRTVYSVSKLIVAFQTRKRPRQSGWENVLHTMLLEGDKQPKLQIYYSFARVALEKLTQFKAQDFSNLVWSFAKLSISHQELFEKVAEQIVSCNLHSFNSQALSNTLWAYAALNMHNPRLFDEMANHIVRIPLRNFAPQELSTTLWAFAKFGAFDQKLFENVATHISQLSFKQWKPQELSNVMWAYATAGIAGEMVTVLFEKAANHIAGLRSLDQFAPQAFSNILWACASCGIYHKRLFNRVAEQIVGPSMLDRLKFEPVALTNIVWAYGKLLHHYSLVHRKKEEGFQQLFQKIACLLLKLHSFNCFEEAHLCKLVCAYAHAGINDPLLFQRFSLVCIQRREKFIPQGIF